MKYICYNINWHVIITVCVGVNITIYIYKCMYILGKMKVNQNNCDKTDDTLIVCFKSFNIILFCCIF